VESLHLALWDLAARLSDVLAQLACCSKKKKNLFTLAVHKTDT
jgi:hypothetical protein